MSFWKPFLNQFAQSLASRKSKTTSAEKNRRRGFQPRFEPLEGRVLLTSVTGDFNGDGIADLAIGTVSQTVNGITNAGAVQILYGTSRTSSVQSGSVDPGLNGLTTTNDQLITQATTGLKSAAVANGNFGSALAVGDFNHDGIMDLAIGASGATVNGATGAGAVFILFGSHTGLKTTGGQMWTENSTNIAGTATAGDHFGAALAAGDFNNDHFTDLAVGVPNKSISGKANAGAVNVIYGALGGLKAANNKLWDQSLLNAGTIGTGDLFGSALAVGDFNADGFRDLAVGSPDQTVGGNANAGAVNVIYGRLGGLNALNNQFWTAGVNNILGHSNAGAQFGFALATGDFNDDSRSDLVIGAPGENIDAVGSAALVNNAGAVHVLLGSSARLTATGNQLWTENSTGMTNTNTTAASGDRFGATVAVGQMNSDRLSDLAIGVPNQTVAASGQMVNPATAAGTVRVLYGAAKSSTNPTAGLSTTNSQIWDQAISGILGDGVDNNELFGSGLAIGDFNGDHIADLAVEVPGETDQGTAGAANIIYGTSTGLNAGGSAAAQQQNQFWLPRLNRLFFDPTVNAKNLRDGNAFLAANKTKPGVITTADGVQYKILSNPTPNAAVPTDSDTVSVEYTGTLIDGTVFDASSQHPDMGTTNQTSFQVNGVVPGFAEMLKLMHVGEHVTVYIPTALAYGVQGQGTTIGPNQVLIFDLKLDSIS